MEQPECPVCLQPFDHNLTIPRVLACGHSSCESCLINLPKPPFPHTIRCPACTQLVTYPQHPSSLPKNIDLLRIISSPSSSSNPKPKTHNSSFQDFIPNLFSHEFFITWKDWILPQDTVRNLDGLVVSEKDVNLKVHNKYLMKCLKRNRKVSLFKLGVYLCNDEDRFKYSYVTKGMWVLSKMGDGVLGELELILKSSLMEYRICSACGLWYNEDDGNLYMVCEKRESSLVDVVVGYDVEVDMSSFGMIGMELCETVSRLHDVEFVIGCTSLSCFGVDEFGHVFIDLNEVLMVGGRLQKLLIESAHNDDGKRLVIDAFPSPELLIQFVKKQGVELESTCEVGYGSDVWSLGCIVLWFLVGKSFVEEANVFLSSYILKLLNGNAYDCEGLHVAWLDTISGLLDNRLDSGYESLKKLLCKCLSHDPGSRPLVGDIWKCMRELIISPKFDVIVSTERNTRGGAFHCLLLGDLLWSTYKTTRVDDKKGMMNNLKDETLVVGSDVIEGVCKNYLTCTDLKGHLDCISGLAIGGGFLFSSSFDKTINVWSLQDLNRVHTFKGHEHKVMALVFVESELPLCISGDNGGEIFIWGIKFPFEEKPVKRLNEEKDWRYSGIHALAVDSRSGFFYTGSGDKSVKAWSMHDDYSLSCTMIGHKSVVCTLAVCDGVLYSGSWDGTIRLWCLNDHTPLAVLGEEAPCGSVLSLAAHTDMLVAAHENGRIKIWNKDVPLKPVSSHSSSIFSIYMEGQWLFSGGWSKTVVVQKLTSGDESQVDVTEIGSIAGDSVVTALHYWQGRLFVGHADRTIKVYSAGG